MTTTYEHKTELVGDDYLGLPIVGQRITRPSGYSGKPKASGLPWDQITDEYVARGGQVDASVWPKTSGPVVQVGGNANSSRANLHTFTEAVEYTEPSAAPMRVRRPRPKRTATSATQRALKVPVEKRAEIADRYAKGETIPGLAVAYNVSAGSIRYAINKAGGTIRSKKEAAALYRDGRKS